MMKPKEGQWENIDVGGEKRTYHVKCREDDKHRYVLELRWKTNLPTKKIIAILLNPSKADSGDSDPTSRNLIRLLKDYSFIVLCNLYPHRSPQPKKAILDNEIAKKFNDKILKKYIDKFDEIFCGWGGNKLKITKGLYDKRIDEIFQMLKGKILWKKKGSLINGKYPRHPGYISCEGDIEPYTT